MKGVEGHSYGAIIPSIESLSVCHAVCTFIVDWQYYYYLLLLLIYLRLTECKNLLWKIYIKIAIPICGM